VGKTLSESILLNLPAASLDLLRGDRRTRLIAYLERWDQHATLEGYVNGWLAAQPESVTLREVRARTLVALGRVDEAFALLDELDGERPRTQTRWLIRLHALKAAGRLDGLRALAPEPDEETEMDVSAWLRYGDVCRAAGRMDEAADAYGRVTELAPESTAPLRRLAELALETGDAAAARGHIETLLVRNADRRPTVEELRLLRDACRDLDDAAAVRSLDDQLARRESEERTTLEAEFGHHEDQSEADDPASLPLSAPGRGSGGGVAL
jgi:ATP-dependent DNA helicase RecQ